MGRKRDERRFLTGKYQKKQLALYKLYYRGAWYTGYDDIDDRKGHFRRHSYRDCGISNCSGCGNPRRVKWNPKKLQMTIQERRIEPILNEQLREYFFSEHK